MVSPSGPGREASRTSPTHPAGSGALRRRGAPAVERAAEGAPAPPGPPAAQHCRRAASTSGVEAEVTTRLYSAASVRHEQRRRGLHGAEARLRPVLQPLVRREVPEGGGRRRGRPLRAALQAVPALRTESY